MEALSAMRDSGIDTTSNAFTNANELFDGVNVIKRVLDERYTENSFIEAPFGLKLERKGWLWVDTEKLAKLMLEK